MQTRLKPTLLVAGIAAAAAPLLILLALVLFQHPSVKQTRAEFQPVQPAPSSPPTPAFVVPSADAFGPVQTSVQPFELPPAHVIGAQVMLGEFRVVAINRYWANAESAVLTLEQALDSGDCVIRESGQSGHVIAEINGDRPVLALTGELLLGGKQDRLVARSTVLEPGKHNLPVFAAETWQWPAGEVPFEKVMRHDPSRPLVDLNVKAAIYQASTAATVREAISQVTTELKVPDAEGRGAYVAAYEVPRAAGIDALVEKGRQIACVFTVGFAVYRNGRLVAAEIFDSTNLFSRVRDQLLRSYAMTAVYGDVSNWSVDLPRPEPTPPQPEPAPANPGYVPPNEYAPPPRPLGEISEDGTRRFECRRATDTPPVHIGIFRK